MTDDSAGLSVASYYRGWHLANEALIDAIAPLTPEQLALPVGPSGWQVWSIASHIAGTRVYWLCTVFGEPGAETTPFTEPGVGWEDDPSHPRSADELVHALASTWNVVERTLERWTPETLSHEVERRFGDVVRIHSRQSVIIRMITHDAYHCGEVALTLGSHGLGGKSQSGPIDMWAGLSRAP